MKVYLLYVIIRDYNLHEDRKVPAIVTSDSKENAEESLVTFLKNKYDHNIKITWIIDSCKEFNIDDPQIVYFHEGF